MFIIQVWFNFIQVTFNKIPSYNYKRIEEIYSRQVPFMLQIYLSYYYKVTKKLQVCTKYISNILKFSPTSCCNATHFPTQFCFILLPSNAAITAPQNNLAGALFTSPISCCLQLIFQPCFSLQNSPKDTPKTVEKKNCPILPIKLLKNSLH